MFDYVMSGVAYCRITYDQVYGDPELLEKIRSILIREQGNNGHLYSFLYNAYAEPGIGKGMWSNYIGAVDKIYSDSGGLQVVTRGIDPTYELRSKVYDSQGSSSNIAMSFDLIPVRASNQTSSVTDSSTRTFDRSFFEEAALASAKYLEEQIDHFDKMESATKPLLIVHGNNLNDFCRWVEIFLDHIPEEKHHKIAGLSLSGASLGWGELENIERLFAFSQIQAPDYLKKHLHLLGVGAPARMVICSIFSMSGLYDKDIRISYDSTAHSACVPRGQRVRPGGSVECYGRDDLVKMHGFREELEEKFPGMIELDFTAFSEVLTITRIAWAEKYGKDQLHHYHLAYYLATMASVLNSTALTYRNSTSKDALVEYCGTKGIAEYMLPLLKVKTLDDFNHWMKNIGTHVKSERITSEVDSNIRLRAFADITEERKLPPPKRNNAPKPLPSSLAGFLD